MIFSSAFVLLLSLSACSTPEEKLADTRRELNSMEDALFQQYGGSQVANEIDANARKESNNDAGPLGAILGQVMGNTAREMDRATFIGDCVNVGRGAHVPFITDKGRAFFTQQSTVDACTKIAAKAAEVEHLEAEVAAAAAK